MTFEVRLRPEAERDLAEAAGWYESHREDLGDRFLDEVVAALAAISDLPLGFPEIHRNTRRALIRRFPFGVYYVVEDSEVVVVAVMHASRSPRRWKVRD